MRPLHAVRSPWVGALALVARRTLPAAGALVAFLVLFDLLGGLVQPRFAAAPTWLALDPAEEDAARVLLPAAAVFILWGLISRPRGWRYVLTQALVVFWAVVAGWAGARYYADLARGAFYARIPFPVPWLTALALGATAIHFHRASNDRAQEETSPEMRVLAGAAAGGIVVGVFLLAQFFLFGTICHLRRADCIIVMGAGVRPDGAPSLSLYDRTRTGCQLCQAGFSDRLIFSGGPSVAGPSEAQVMRDLAVRLGVPAEECILDEDGLSTFCTAMSVRRIMQLNGWRNSLVVSHEYHLSRTWLTLRRAGIEAFPVPARRTRIIWKDFWSVLREAAAWVYYYFRPLAEPLGRPYGGPLRAAGS